MIEIFGKSLIPASVLNSGQTLKIFLWSNYFFVVPVTLIFRYRNKLEWPFAWSFLSAVQQFAVYSHKLVPRLFSKKFKEFRACNRLHSLRKLIEQKNHGAKQFEAAQNSNFIWSVWYCGTHRELHCRYILQYWFYLDRYILCGDFYFWNWNCKLQIVISNILSFFDTQIFALKTKWELQTKKII